LNPAKRRETLVNTAIMLYNAHQATTLDITLGRIVTLDHDLDDELLTQIEPVTVESIQQMFESWRPNRFKRIALRLGKLARKIEL